MQKGVYAGLTFHRYEPGFVIQGGDPKGDGTGGYIEPGTASERRIPLEVKPHLQHGEAGVVAMARANEPNSASSQFYITLAPARFLDMQYAVFGRVIDGLPTVLSLRRSDKILEVAIEGGYSHNINEHSQNSSQPWINEQPEAKPGEFDISLDERTPRSETDIDLE